MRRFVFSMTTILVLLLAVFGFLLSRHPLNSHADGAPDTCMVELGRVDTASWGPPGYHLQHATVIAYDNICIHTIHTLVTLTDDKGQALDGSNNAPRDLQGAIGITSDGVSTVYQSSTTTGINTSDISYSQGGSITFCGGFLDINNSARLSQISSPLTPFSSWYDSDEYKCSTYDPS